MAARASRAEDVTAGLEIGVGQVERIDQAAEAGCVCRLGGWPPLVIAVRATAHSAAPAASVIDARITALRYQPGHRPDLSRGLTPFWLEPENRAAADHLLR